MSVRLLLAATLAALAVPALATPQPRNATDMWLNPAESGWGFNVIHQGNTLFGTLFVYGTDGQPKWYVASSLTGDASSYSGALAECTGAWFGGAFDARPLSCRQVGTLVMNVGDASGTVDYTVDGVHVTKAVTRFTFRPTLLTGLHRAFVYQLPASGLFEIRRDLETFSVLDDGAQVTVNTSSDAETSCTYSGNHGQDGQIETVSGTYACGGTASGRSGNWSMRVDPTPSGFVGTFSDGNTPAGRIAGALHGGEKLEGTGWRNGMWFVPTESGWGLNVIEQGDTIFATLYVFDAQGRPHWYVASDLVQSGTTGNGTAINTGALYEATGPYFGAGTFNPSSVTRRQVGTMSFQATSPGAATLSYSVDGVAVTKALASFAFARNDPSGSYAGQITGTGPSGGAHDPSTLTIQDANGTFSMRIAGMFGGTCDYKGSSVQRGDAIYASGSLTCGGAASADFQLRDLTVTLEGVTGQVDLTNVTGFVQDGLTSFAFAGARTTVN